MGQAEPNTASWNVTIPWRPRLNEASAPAPDARPMLFASHDAARAGAQLLLLEHLKRFTRLTNVEPYLLLLSGGELEREFQEVAHVLNVPALVSADCDRDYVIGKVVEDIARRQPWLAVCNTVLTHPVGAACRKANIPVLSIVHELPTSIDALDPASFHHTFEHSRTIIVVSEFVRRALARRYGVDPERLTVRYAGVLPFDGWDIPREQARREVFEEFRMDPDGFLILGCGSVHPRKGTDLFVQVARRILLSRRDRPCHFLWVGEDQGRPPFRQWCQHDIEASDIADFVHLAGGRPDPGRYYRAADAFALTSREDPFPLVNLEAMSAGLPVVAFEGAGGATEVLSGGAGIVVPYLDVDAMADQLLELARDADYRTAIGERAARRIAQDYGWDRYFEDLVQILIDDFDYQLPGSAGREPSCEASTGGGQDGPEGDPGPSPGLVDWAGVSRISVVIPSYNHSAFIARAIESVFEQDVDGVELIVVDDGSTDGSPQVIRQVLAAHPDRRAQLFEQANAGAHAAIMRGIEASTGRLVTLLNSDDFYLPGRFTQMLPAMSEEADCLAFSMIRFVDGLGQPLPATAGWPAWYEKCLEDGASCPTVGYALLRHNFSVTSGNFIFSRSLYDKLHGFSSHKFAHDWDFLLRSVYYTEPIFVRQPLLAYRIHASNTTESVRHLLYPECRDALMRYLGLCAAGTPPNRYAPCREHWPRYFDLFVRTYPPFFAKEPIAHHLEFTESPA